MPNTTPPNEPRCSFCGKTETQANQLVSGPDGVHICDECIATCNEMMAQNAIEQVREDERLLTPQEIKARLDEYVISRISCILSPYDNWASGLSPSDKHDCAVVSG